MINSILFSNESQFLYAGELVIFLDIPTIDIRESVLDTEVSSDELKLCSN